MRFRRRVPTLVCTSLFVAAGVASGCNDRVWDFGNQLIPPDAGKRKGTRPGWDGGLYAFMRRVLSTDHGGALYAKRQGMIEPVFVV